MNSKTDFQWLVQRFFIERLMQQKKVSGHTISSYRDTFRLLLRFAHKRLHKSPDHLTFEDIDAPLIGNFLNDLEKTRNIGPRTRNLRLTAIRSFFRYASAQAPEYSQQIQRVLSMHGARFDSTVICFLTRPEVDAILTAPDQSTWRGRRDHALLRLAVETGLRVSEISGLTRDNIYFDSGTHVSVIGKGRKERITPISTPTARILKNWMKEPSRFKTGAIFPSMRGGHLSSDAIQHMVKVYATAASKACPSLRKKHVTPHVLRHTAAMELLQAGIDPISIALWMGHESLQTTQVYLSADMERKERILSSVKSRGGKTSRYHPDEGFMAFLASL
jgi:site-specific recombinase XerD